MEDRGGSYLDDRNGERVDYTGPTRRPSSAGERLDANIAVLETLKVIDDENRFATPEEQTILAAWSGWGALPEIFDPTSTRFDEFRRMRVQELLGDEGMEQAAATTLNAHYTDSAVAQAMWSSLQRAGLNEGTVLEPGCGAGEFIGQAPDGVDMVGVELDETTAQIAALLYPNQQIQASGYEKTRFVEGSFDAVIGNVPFGNFPVADQMYNAQDHSIHNYFINKSLRMTAPGGYVAVMTSTWTMDSVNTKARREMARYGDLVGAVRLPEGSMRSSAGTDVGVDILVLRRRGADDPLDEHQINNWVEPGTITLRDTEGEVQNVTMSQYFVNHPENIIGTVRYQRDQYGGDSYRVSHPTPEDVGQDVDRILTRLVDTTAFRYNPGLDEETRLSISPGLHYPPSADAEVGHVRFSPESGQFVEYSEHFHWVPVDVKANLRVESQRLLELRDAVTEVIAVQSRGEDASAAREQLSGLWQNYVEKYGPINRYKPVLRTPSPKRQREIIEDSRSQWFAQHVGEENAEPGPELEAQWVAESKEKVISSRSQVHLNFLKGDPKMGLLLAMENFDDETMEATPGPVMSRDVIQYISRPESAETAADAMVISLNETRTIEVDRIAELLNIDVSDVPEQLQGLAFMDPQTHTWVPQVQYLAGDVRAKYEQAQEAARFDSQYQPNVEALSEVIPTDVSIDDLVINPGVQWIDTDVYSQFVAETFEADCAVKWDPAGKTWIVDAPRGGFSRYIGFTWGTQDRSPAKVLESAMNQREGVVYTEVEGKRVKDKNASAAMAAKMAQVRTAFDTWVKADPDRAAAIEETYNRTFNSRVHADYAQLGQALQLPGKSEAFEPYSYQRQAVARIVSEPTVLLDHVVGAGKTGTMTMAAQELKRTGIVNKPAMVVPNHLVEQIAREYVQWYPAANVLAVPTGLNTSQRRDWMGRVAAGDWDCVILPMTTFEKVGIDPVKRAGWLKEEIDELRALLDSDGVQDRFSVKNVERAIKRIQTQYEKVTTNEDPGITWEQTGIDYLFVDEAHLFKNLARQSDIRELAHTGSQRASDLNHKLRSMRETKLAAAQRAGHNTTGYLPAVATFATGTPVSNALAEMWVLQHYLRPDILTDLQAETVTSWGQLFTTTDTMLRPRMSGQGLEVVTAVSSYVNVPEMVQINQAFTDTVTADDLEAVVPEIEGGQTQMLTREQSFQMAEYTEELNHRIDKVRAGAVNADKDNMLKISSDGRKAALDVQLVGLTPDEDGGRAQQVADEIMAIHDQTADRQYTDPDGRISARKGGLQIVFCDTGINLEKPEEFSVYRQIKTNLIQAGMDPDKIAFIHDARNDRQRAEIFEKARDGRLSVLIGSTEKMGTGANIQTRAVALHHVDVPWKPADLEQRLGRALRQGNQNETIIVRSYGTEASFDLYSWNLIERKAKFINAVRAGNLHDRVLDDPFSGLEMDASTAQAAISGDPRLQQLGELDAEVQKVESLQAAWLSQRTQVRHQLGIDQRRLEVLNTTLIPGLQQLEPRLKETTGDAFRFTTNTGAVLSERTAAGDYVFEVLRKQAVRTDQLDFLDRTTPEPLGTVGGITLGVSRQANEVLVAPMDMPEYTKRWLVPQLTGQKPSTVGMMTSLENFVAKIPAQIAEYQKEAARLQEQIPASETILEEPSPHLELLEQLKSQHKELVDEMTGKNDSAEATGQDEGVDFRGEDIRATFGERSHAATRPRHGDVWAYGKSEYYRIIIRRDEDEAQRVYGYPADEPEPAPENLEEHQMDISSSRFSLVSRNISGLTPFERDVMTRDARTDDVVHSIHALENGTRVRAETADGEDIEGIVRGYQVVTDNGNYNANRIRPTFLVAGVRTVEEYEQLQQEEELFAARRSFWELPPGVAFTEDVDGYGYAGDIKVVDHRNDGSLHLVVAPDTGQVRSRPSRGRLANDRKDWPITEAAIADEEQMIALYGEAQPQVAVDDLRVGDRVISSDVKVTGQKQLMQVTNIFHDYRGVNLSLVGNDHERVSKHLRTGTVVQVVQRTQAALTANEYLSRAIGEGAPKLRPLSTVDPTGMEGQRIVVDSLTNNLDPNGDKFITGTITGINTTYAYRGTGIEVTDDQGSVHTFEQDLDRTFIAPIGDAQVSIRDWSGTNGVENISDPGHGAEYLPARTPPARTDQVSQAPEYQQKPARTHLSGQKPDQEQHIQYAANQQIQPQTPSPGALGMN